MDFVKGLFSRDYETALDIENMSVNDILQIPPDKISTTKIIADDFFKHIHPEKQAAVKYIAEQKRMRDEFGFPYPKPEKMVVMFNIDRSKKREVDDEISEAGFDVLKEREVARRTFENLLPTPTTSTTRKLGGKKRSRKQKRRKTRRKKML